MQMSAANLISLLSSANRALSTAIVILSFPAVSHPNAIPLWLTMTIIGRDVTIVTAALVLYKLRGQKEFPPSLTGKASTVCQMGTILGTLLFNILDRAPDYLTWLYILTFILTVISGFGYGVRGFRSLSRKKP